MWAIAVSSVTTWRLGLVAGYLSFAFVDFALPSDCVPWGKRPTERQPSRDVRQRSSTDSAQRDEFQHMGEESVRVASDKIKEDTGFAPSARVLEMEASLVEAMLHQ